MKILNIIRTHTQDCHDPIIYESVIAKEDIDKKDNLLLISEDSVLNSTFFFDDNV